MSIFETQVGGSHYTRLKIQPVQYAMANGYDGCALNIAKYLMRHEHKNGLQDLEKALHFVDLRLECDWPHGTAMTRISVAELAEANGYKANQLIYSALLDLAGLVDYSKRDGHAFWSDRLKWSINAMIQEYKARKPESTPLPRGPCPVDLSFTGDQDKRQDVVGQNGNEGEHYERS